MTRTATREDILALVPHGGAMCLWDAVLDWDDDSIVLEAQGHQDPAHPLRGAQRLHSVHLCEYGAQAMAVHGGLLARRSGGRAAPGMLVALRDVEITPGTTDGGHDPGDIGALPGPLRGEATLLAQGPAGCQYGFRILHAGTCIARGRAAVMPRN